MTTGAGSSAAVTVVIVTRDRARVLADCLRSLVRSEGGRALDVVVLDNASQDETAEVVGREFPSARLVRSQENLGFARAANRGAAMARGDLLLFLNDDTILPGPFLGELAEALGRLPRAGMVGPRLRNVDGTVQASVFRFPSPGRALLGILPIDRILPPGSRLSSYRTFRYDRELPVDFVSGACFLVSRQSFLASGGFDERFFMYGEETDLALRLRARGLQCWFVPVGDIIHLGGATTRVEEPLPPDYLEGHLRYCAAHFGAAGFRLYAAAQLLGALTRGGLAALACRRGRVRRRLAQLRGFAAALVTGRGPFLAGHDGDPNDKGGTS